MKTEYEKQQSAEYYNPDDQELRLLHANSKIFMKNYNEEIDYNKQQEILHIWFKSVGNRCYIEPLFYCEFGKHITLGDEVYINTNGVFLDAAQIKIGSKTVIGNNVQLLTTEHPINPEERMTKVIKASPITIGENCWIGSGVIILPGITIGNHCTIGAGSIVTKDIPDRSVAIGSPCRVIRTV